MPLISVIINVRNGAGTLRQAIDSVLSQSFPDWELIVWDDRSTDASASIVATYSDSRVRYFLSPEDVPLGKARNDAIQHAKGEWIAFLDQDDVWLVHKLEKQVALIADDVGLIYGRTVRFYPSGWERDYDHAHEYRQLPEGDLFGLLFTRSCFIAMSSAMFRSAAVEAVGGIPDQVRIIPDYYLYVAVARKYRVRAVQEVVCRYRMHPDSMSQTVALEMNWEVLWLIDRWAGDIPAQSLGRARRRHFSAIALEEIGKRGTFLTGLKRLITQGSVGSQVKRPFAFAFHVLRRRLRPPYWKRLV
jgi:cellulose synthase/poly-beta-1,6-N-acetylglucosamine synthase-like glycosyltransferase